MVDAAWVTRVPLAVAFALPEIEVVMGALSPALDVADASPEMVMLPRSKLGIGYPFSSPSR